MKPHIEGLVRIADRWPAVESLLRTCQLILIVWLAFYGAQFAAKGVVQAGRLLVGLLH
jgi:hypothetical protein